MTVYPELVKTKSRTYLRTTAVIFCTWAVANVFATYSLYFGVPSLQTISLTIQPIAFVAAVTNICQYTYSHWKSGEHINARAEEEFAYFYYLIPSLIYVLCSVIWNLSNGESSWQNNSEATIAFNICSQFFYGISMIGTNRMFWCCIIWIILNIYVWLLVSVLLHFILWIYGIVIIVTTNH